MALEEKVKNNEEKINTIDTQIKVQYKDEVKVVDREIGYCNGKIEKNLAPIKKRMILIEKELESVSESITAENSKKKSFQTIGELEIKIRKRPCTISIPMPKKPSSFLESQYNEPQLVIGELLNIDNTNIKIPDNRPREPEGTGRAWHSWWAANERFKKRVEEARYRLGSQQESVKKASDLCKFYIYKENIYLFDDIDMHSQEEQQLLIKEHHFKQDKKMRHLRKDIKLFEMLESRQIKPREPIPEDVRFLVWRRDGGKCIMCGSKNKLEFDHIIPVSKGGSSNERNIQLLCEKCNREKSDKI